MTDGEGRDHRARAIESFEVVTQVAHTFDDGLHLPVVYVPWPLRATNPKWVSPVRLIWNRACNRTTKRALRHRL